MQNQLESSYVALYSTSYHLYFSIFTDETEFKSSANAPIVNIRLTIVYINHEHSLLYRSLTFYHSLIFNHL